MSLNQRLKQFLTLDQPLGPSDASKITDWEVAAKLFDPHNTTYNNLLRKETSIVFGRRGSGKTALLNSYRYHPYLDENSQNEIFPLENFEILIEINTHDEFSEILKKVSGQNSSIKFIESVVDEWEKLIIDYYLAYLIQHQEEVDNDCLTNIQNYLRQEENEFQQDVRRAVWGDSLWTKIKNLLSSKNNNFDKYLSQKEAMNIAEDYLTQIEKNAIIIFDSMDEYKVGNENVDRTIGALLRFIQNFNDTYKNVKIKIGLPSEIFPEIMRTSGNPLKDFANYDEITWTAIELQQIAAYRFKLFLELYDSEFAKTLNKYNLNSRSDLHSFWNKFFPTKHNNKYNLPEEVLIYILRHTHLLPRQMLMILREILVLNHEITGGFRKIGDESILTGVENMEVKIAGEIFGAFRNVYPYAEIIGRAVFGNFSTIFDFDELEVRWRRYAKHHMSQISSIFEMVHFAEMLIRMGIIGIVEEETDLYFVGRFNYDALTPFNVGSGSKLCLHPIFSKHFNAALNNAGKAILPKGIHNII